MIDRTLAVLHAGGAEMVRQRLSGSRLMCAGLVVTLVGIALGFMASYEIPSHWTTAVVGVAVLLGGALRHMLARSEVREDDEGRG
jgi:uncharacterized membrane protein HdeD (DUF308 family)